MISTERLRDLGHKLTDANLAAITDDIHTRFPVGMGLIMIEAMLKRIPGQNVRNSQVNVPVAA